MYLLRPVMQNEEAKVYTLCRREEVKRGAQVTFCLCKQMDA